MSAPSNLALRVLVAVIFGPLFLLLFWFGSWALLAGLWVVVGLGTWEFYRLQRSKGLHPWTRFGIAASLVWCLWVHSFGVALLIYPMLGLVLAVLVLSLCRREGRFRIADGSATLVGVLYVGFLGSFA
ncbi:MAG: phosphatidate cytidylyltransferase, partial [Candidatus Latescibacteria bacterium]|nr:phosphatidate cytidylyltransferase [Candidatus Latescibacterota bacterium]